MLRIHLHVGKVPIKGSVDNVLYSESKGRKMKKGEISNHNTRISKVNRTVEQSEDISTSVQVCLPKVFLCLLLNLFIDFMSAV